MQKQKIFQELKKLGWRMVTTIILTLTAGGTLWVYAAFVEPAAGPSSSTQDFLQNILGADNNNNSFASTNVVANRDGSLIERQEYIANKASWQATAMSASNSSAVTFAAAVAYCQSLSAAAYYSIDGDTTTTFTDWRLPTASEAALFVDLVDDQWTWTATPVDQATYEGYWFQVDMADGDTYYDDGYGADTEYVNCVR